MEIIFIRHAKAEKKREDLEDIRRYLTQEGKEKFRRIMPELKEKLHPLENRKIILWSSPATRALETAHMIARGLQIETNLIHDFLYERDDQTFCEEIKKIKEEITLVIVGHEPFLSDWIKQMTGEDLKIKTGDVLHFKVSQQSPLEVEFQWAISPVEF